MVSQLRADLHAKALASTHPGRHSESPEPATPSGVRPGQALLDGDPPLVNGPRQRKSTERGQIQADKMHALNEKRAQREASQQSQPTASQLTASQPTASGRRGRPTDIRPLGQPNANTTTSGRHGQSTDLRQLSQSNARTTMPNSKPQSHKPRSQSQPGHRVRVRETDAKANKEQLRRKRERNLKRIACSPSPGSTDVEPEEPSQHTNAQPPAESQYTYIWNNVGYESLVDYASARLGYNVQGWTEDQILAKLDKIEYIEGYENYKKTSVESPRNHTSTVVLPPAPVAVGGGWHRANEPAPGPAPVPQATVSRPAKRPVDAADGATIKQMRLADPDNTDTEPESDEEPVLASTGPRPPPAPPAPPAVRAEPAQPPIATLTRQSTSTTVPETPLEGQSTSSSPLSGPSASRFPPLPRLMSTMNMPRGPVHARLQTKVMARDCLADLAAVALGEDVEMSELETQQETQGETQEETQEEKWQEIWQVKAPPITYAGYRSHIDSPDDTPVPRAPPPTRANSPAPAQRQSKRPRAPANSVLAHLERLQMADTMRDLIRAGHAEAMSRSSIRRAEPSTPPKTATQQSSSASGTSGKKSSRRLEPVAAARSDMVEFNKRCAHDNATSFVQSVTRQNEHGGRCTLREGEQRYQHELLPDNEEDLAHDEALRQGKQPIHLFTFALSEGIYQTRATFMMWAALVHEATWRMELPDVPYVAATTEELEVMVNYLATLRGKMKERVRPIVGPSRGFNHCVATQQDIQENLDLFHKLHPNSFHCTSTRPRRGHYEHIDIARCIAASFFYGPNAVGVLFPDYFEDMPLTIVAFVLAIMQFCIEEWSSGYFTSRDLGAANMLDKYEAHLAGLKDLRKTAPRRLERMQDGWFEYASEYSGACFIREKCSQECTPRKELRPDTPPPPPPCQSSSQGSSQESSRGATSVHALAPTSIEDDDDDLYEIPDYNANPFFTDDQRALTPSDVESHAPTPPPAAEYNEHGCQTARSKGKGCARD